MSTLAFTMAAIAACVDPDEIHVEEVGGNGRAARGGYHAFNIEIKALKTKGQGANLGPVAKGQILGRAMEALQAAGYQVEDRNGYRGRDGQSFVSWPHLRVQEPGTGFGAASQELQETIRQQTNMIQQLIALQAASNPQLAAALAAQAATGSGTPETSESSETDEGVAEGESTFGE